MIEALRRVLVDDEGGALIEFALVLSLASVVTIAALEAFVNVLYSVYEAQATGYYSIGEYAR